MRSGSITPARSTLGTLAACVTAGLALLAVMPTGPAAATEATQTSRTSTATGWSSVSAGWHVTCGIRTDHTLWCWGSNTFGELGQGPAGPSRSAVPLQVGARADWTSVDVGYQQVCAIRSDASAWCWGDDYFGEIGDGHFFGVRSTPVEVANGGRWASISAGEFTTCGVKTDGSGWCWGDNFDGEFGDGAQYDSSDVPVEAQREDGGWARLSAGYGFTCGLTDLGRAFCWGRGNNGQLGRGFGGESDTPQLVVHPISGAPWTGVTAGFAHACGVGADGTASCWGDGLHGALGDGQLNAHTFTATLVSGSQHWVAVSAGKHFTCGVDATQAAWCWGTNQDGELGDGGSRQALTPERVAGGHRWVALSAGFFQSCGVDVAGTAWCWGENGDGELGDGSLGGLSNVPVRVAG